MSVDFRATIVPSLRAATSTWLTWSRACALARRFSRRSSSQRTGRRSRRASSATTTSSGYMCIFGPKPPPTDGHSTRSRESGIPSTSASPLRSRCGVCDDAHTVSRPSTGSTDAITPRVSIGDDEHRAWRKVSDSRISADSSACCTPPFSKWVWKMMLSPISSCRRGAPARMPASASATTGSGSYVTLIASSASSARYWSVATTAATASPAKRTLP